MRKALSWQTFYAPRFNFNPIATVLVYGKAGLSVEWEKITAGDLVKFKEERVCIVPLGSLEKHGEHLPLGIDGLVANRIAMMAAEKEPVAVLPPLYYTYVKEMKNLPGAVSLETGLLLKLLENICDEVARNGFKKIILLNGHEGNIALLKVLSQHLVDKGKDYAVFVPPIFLAPDVIKEVKETSETGHACEIETSIALYLYPELCKMDRIPDGFYSSKKDYDASPAYVGDARKASIEKGKRIVDAQVEKLVELIRKIKKDDKVLSKIREFTLQMQQT